MRRVILIAVVSLLALSSTSAAATTHALYAWARPGKTVVGVSTTGLGLGAPVVRHVAPGRYRVRVAAFSNLAFHLVGPGVDKQTPFTTASFSPIYRTWNVRLRRGRYGYSAEGLYAKELHAAGIRTRGVLSVP